MPPKKGIQGQAWLGVELTDEQQLTLKTSHAAYSKPLEAVEAILDINPVGKARARVMLTTSASGQKIPIKPKNKKTESWERAFREFIKPFKPEAMYWGPIEVDIIAVFERPKSKSKEPGYLLMPQKPDFDNIAKIVIDSINNEWFYDDAQVSIGRTVKLFAKPGERGRIYISIKPIKNKDAKHIMDFLDERQKALGFNPKNDDDSAPEAFME